MNDRPNILLITSDQQHHGTLGSVNDRIRTPALDRLAREGTRFTRAYTNNPVCSPSRSTIITGLYPSWHHCWSIGVKLPEDVPTVGDVFQQHGYDTSLIGKAHFQPLASRPDLPDGESLECPPLLRDLAFWRDFRGPWYGFRYVETARMHTDEALAGQHYAIWMEEEGLTNWRDYFQLPDGSRPPREHSWDLPAEYHYSTWTAEKTIELIERHVRDARPFFCWSSFHDPHPSYLVPEPWDTMYDPADMESGSVVPGEHDRNPPHFRETQKTDVDFSTWQETPHANHGFQSHVELCEEARLRKDMAVYYGMVSFMDQQIGRILDALDRLGIADNTLVVFTTDHGHLLGQHGLAAKGAFHYEDMLRLPFLVRWRGRVPAGATCDALQALIDLPVTFLRAAGIEVPGLMQGVDQLDVWSGRQETARDHVIAEFRHQPTAIHLRTFIDERYKITAYRDQSYGEFFDLQKDPHEVHNRWDDPACAETKARLFQKWINAEIKREPTRMPRVALA